MRFFSVSGYNINKINDAITITKSVNKISKEAVNATKTVVRDGADVLETTGDSMVVVAPLTGPAAPAVAGIGGTLSTVGTSTNIALDVVEGSYESAGNRVVNEVITGGLSTIVKNAPGVNETTSQIIDAKIEIYDNVIIPKIQEKIKENKPK